jgi:hypothetical protein
MADFPTAENPTAENPPSIINRGTKTEIQKQNTFGDFWKQYPKKEKKLEAERAFLRLSEKDRDHATTILPLHIAHWRKKYGADQKGKFPVTYVPHASTWLNGRRWEDELSEIPAASGPQSSGLDAEQQEKRRKQQEEQRRYEQDAERVAAEKKARFLDSVFRNLPLEQQAEITEEARKSLPKGIELLNQEYQYSALLSKIRNLTAQLADEVF